MFRNSLFMLLCIICISYALGQTTPEVSPARVATGSPSATINCNLLSLAFNADGAIGLNGTTVKGGTINNIRFLYSSGCILSGYYQNTLWSSGMFSSSKIKDFVAKNGIFPLDKNKADFNSEWTDWIDAVADGASFYDGDLNGLYQPVDKNANGKWDPQEDRPDLLGDMSYYCAFSDSKPSSARKFTNTAPMGITIGQTIFAARNNQSLARSSLFIRYTITNTGTVAGKLDSVYFSAIIDPDLGDGSDDLAGCDTLREAGTCYQIAPDAVFGDRIPGFYVDFLQGPVSYIPGITFSDVNNNAVYDPEFDTPLDTAYTFKGPVLGKQSFPGARNLGLSSVTHFFQDHPAMGDPKTVLELRNYMIGGRDKSGAHISACSFSYGTVVGSTPCSSISPRYMFSGDPVSASGWLNKYSTDQRVLVNSGPFTLSVDKPIEIIVAYIIGRESSRWPASFNLTREMDDYIQQVYNNNFSTLTAIDNGEVAAGQHAFTLEQNYPNPFNPTTTISYSLPHTSKVTITVFDALGREVAVLVNGEVNSGRHEVLFNAANLSSGIYFYTLKSAEQTISRKLIVLR